MKMVQCCLTCEHFVCPSKRRVGECSIHGDKRHILQYCVAHEDNYERLTKMIDHAEQEGVIIEHR